MQHTISSIIQRISVTPEIPILPLFDSGGYLVSDYHDDTTAIWIGTIAKSKLSVSISPSLAIRTQLDLFHFICQKLNSLNIIILPSTNNNKYNFAWLHNSLHYPCIYLNYPPWLYISLLTTFHSIHPPFFPPELNNCLCHLQETFQRKKKKLISPSYGRWRIKINNLL